MICFYSWEAMGESPCQMLFGNQVLMGWDEEESHFVLDKKWLLKHKTSTVAEVWKVGFFLDGC